MKKSQTSLPLSFRELRSIATAMLLEDASASLDRAAANLAAGLAAAELAAQRGYRTGAGAETRGAA